jgi:hypothetical protein
MSNSNQTPVQSAFEQLLEEVEDEFTAVNSAGADAFKGGDHDRARALLDRADQLKAFREKVVALRKEWEALLPPKAVIDGATGPTVPAHGKKLKTGLRTPEREYMLPILQALDEHGGSASTGIVLDRVHELMQGKLKDVDNQPLSSDPDMPRWRNAAQWARDTLVKDGLMHKDSPRGTWEITDEGRKRLEK